jgi:ABC-type multidrug transport system fused ATPase/permease subunit
MSGRHQFAVCTLALAVAGLSMIPLELQRRMVNGALDQSDIGLLLELGAVYLAVVLVQAVLKYGLHLYQGWLSESATLYCRSNLSELHDERATDDGEAAGGAAVSVIGSEIDKLGGFVGEGLAQPCVNIGTIVAIGGYMIVVEPMIALFSLPFIVPQLIAAPWMQGLINRLLEERVVVIRHLSDAIAALSDLKDSKVGGYLETIYDNRIRTFVLKFAMKGLINLLNALAPLSALIVGGYFVMQGETSVGVIVAFISGFDRLADPLRELIADYRLFAQANVQHKMIARWMT